MVMSFLAQCLQARGWAQQNRHRQVVWLNGDQAWCYRQLLTCRSLLAQRSLLVAEQSQFESLTHGCEVAAQFSQVIKAKQCQRLLGSEFDCAVYDAFSGVNPEGLAQICGSLVAGSLLVIVTPSLQCWEQWDDPETDNLWVHPYKKQQVRSLFLARLASFLQASCILRYAQSNPQIALPTVKVETLPRDVDYREQNSALKKLIAQVMTRPNSNAVVSADRGRGKSALLGMLGNAVGASLPVYLTAPSKRSVASVQHFCDDQLAYMTPERLLGQLSTLTSRALLLIDEAAALPSHVLTRFMLHFDHCVFSTTEQGYEGSGQGFNLRFRPRLEAYDAQVCNVYLSTPVRFAANDPLEQWLNRLLLMRSHERCVGGYEQPLVIAKHEQVDLAQNSALLEALLQLLVQAHYRTSPNDLRILLDSPNMHLWLATRGNRVQAVCLVALEGPIESADLTQEIWRGVRRPRGNLLPQLLIAQEGMREAGGLRFARIVRIATEHSVRREQLASQLLEQVEQWCHCKKVNAIGANFALRQEVAQFWLKNAYSFVRLGLSVDSVSGEYNTLMLKNVQQAEHLIEALCASFATRFSFQLKRLLPPTAIEAPLVDILNTSLTQPPSLPSAYWQLEQLRGFAWHARSFESIAYLVDLQLYNNRALLASEGLNPISSALLIDYFLDEKALPLIYEKYKISGYKAFVSQMRTAFRELVTVLDH